MRRVRKGDRGDFGLNEMNREYSNLVDNNLHYEYNDNFQVCD